MSLFANFLNASNLEVDMDLWKAECYDENSRLQQTIAQNFLNLLKNQFSLQPDAFLLDLGCGNGRITTSILNSFDSIRILGIDASADMISFANNHFGNSQVMFSVDNVEKLKTIQSNSVDAITSFSCLHWVFDHESAFQRMYDVLKPMGWLGCMFAAETGFDDPLDGAFAQAMEEKPWADYFKAPVAEVGWNIVQPESTKKQLERIGFQVVLMDVQNFNYYFQNSKAFENWILACAQQLKLLPNELQKSCAARIANLYLEATSEQQPSNSQCIYQVDAFMLMAVKPDRV